MASVVAFADCRTVRGSTRKDFWRLAGGWGKSLFSLFSLELPRSSSPCQRTINANRHSTMAKPKQAPPNYGSTTPLNDDALPPSPKPTHMTTYTAGEDAGRLASLAKEFGLAKRREPREGVRVRVTEDLGELNLHRLKVSSFCNFVYRTFPVCNL